MSQAIQYNSSVAMTRHPHLLQRAAALTPALHRQRQAPQAIVEAVADPAALNGWRGHTVCTPEQFYQQPQRRQPAGCPGPSALHLRRNAERSLRAVQRVPGVAEQ